MADHVLQITGEQLDEVLSKSPEHYNSKQNPHETKAPFLGKWKKEGLSQQINADSTFNLLKVLDLTADKVFIGNIDASAFSLVNATTDNALLKLPNLNFLVDYTIVVRLEGTIGTGSAAAEFYVNLKRADGSIVDSKDVVKTLSTSLNRKEVSFETASFDQNDNFITSGIKIEIQNPTGGRTVTLTSVEVLIKGVK